MLSNFKLPIYTINQIEVLQRDFLWSQGESKKIHAVNWWSVCQPWQEGGLALRSLALKNSAFQACSGDFSHVPRLHLPNNESKKLSRELSTRCGA